MTLSPFQRDEFGRQKSHMDTGFFKLGEQIDTVEDILTKRADKLEVAMNQKFDEQKSYMDTDFTKLGEQIDAVETNMNAKFGLLSADVSWLKRSMGKVLINMDKVMDKFGIS